MDIKIRQNALSVRGSDFELTDDPINSFEFEVLTDVGTNQADLLFGSQISEFAKQADGEKLVKAEIQRIMRAHKMRGSVNVYRTAKGIHARVDDEVNAYEYLFE